MQVLATMVYVSVMKDGVVHIVPSVNALVVAYMVVATMVYASALLDGVVPIVTSRIVPVTVMVMVFVSTVYVHVNLIGRAHHVTNDYAQVYVMGMVSANKKMQHVYVSMNSPDLHVICVNAQPKLKTKRAVDMVNVTHWEIVHAQKDMKVSHVRLHHVHQNVNCMGVVSKENVFAPMVMAV